jgi:hypothetical protein
MWHILLCIFILLYLIGNNDYCFYSRIIGDESDSFDLYVSSSNLLDRALIPLILGENFGDMSHHY